MELSKRTYASETLHMEDISTFFSQFSESESAFVQAPFKGVKKVVIKQKSWSVRTVELIRYSQLLFFSLFYVGLYFRAIHEDLFWLRVAAKPVPVFCCMVLLVIRGRQSNYTRRIYIALLLSTVGDILLCIHSTSIFLLGAIAFLSAHFLYISAFLIGRPRVSLHLLVLPLCVWSTFVIALQVTSYVRTAAEKAVAMVYFLILMVMVWRSLARTRDKHIPRRSAALSIAGALCFFASDSLLIFSKYVKPYLRELFNYFDIVLYWAAQLLITLSAIAYDVPRPPPRRPARTNKPD
eukprot:gnl/Chilomastix_cuspidata/3390.p3 GENE.gnl/Chilomastix_cuspidata/3390~~gnl/Chilomastix_cuspidata/3390.p3  ORF type:complete len:294 (+),score=59.89 gnl/Chilomastix_cuspidata/3390:15-896(+)